MKKRQRKRGKKRRKRMFWWWSHIVCGILCGSPSKCPQTQVFTIQRQREKLKQTIMIETYLFALPESLRIEIHPFELITALSLIQQIFVECLLYVWCCSRHWDKTVGKVPISIAFRSSQTPLPLPINLTLFSTQTQLWGCTEVRCSWTQTVELDRPGFGAILCHEWAVWQAI